MCNRILHNIRVIQIKMVTFNGEEWRWNTIKGNWKKKLKNKKFKRGGTNGNDENSEKKSNMTTKLKDIEYKKKDREWRNRNYLPKNRKQKTERFTKEVKTGNWNHDLKVPSNHAMN